MDGVAEPVGDEIGAPEELFWRICLSRALVRNCGLHTERCVVCYEVDEILGVIAHLVPLALNARELTFSDTKQGVAGQWECCAIDTYNMWDIAMVKSANSEYTKKKTVPTSPDAQRSIS